MRLLRLGDVNIGSNDRVFRHPRVRAPAIYLVAIGVVGCMFFYAYTRSWKVGYVFGSGGLLFLALTVRFVTARFRQSNWLARMGETGLYVQYRSYLNYQFPANEPSVCFVSYGEIASARLVRERITAPDPSEQGGTQTKTLRYVELELAGDITSLARALQTEQVEKPPMERHWYGKTSTVYQDYPVSMSTPPFLRIHWDVVPSAHVFLDALHSYTPILEPVVVAQDFTHLESLAPEQQNQRLRELAKRGDVVTAIYTARRLHGCGLEQAKQMVERLRDSNTTSGGPLGL